MMGMPTIAYMLHSASKIFNLIRPVCLLNCPFIFPQSTVSRLFCDTSGNTRHKICWTYLFLVFLYWLQIHIYYRVNIFGNTISFYKRSLALLRLKTHWRPLLQSWVFSFNDLWFVLWNLIMKWQLYIATYAHSFVIALHNNIDYP